MCVLSCSSDEPEIADALQVKLPWGRIKAAAVLLGSMELDTCPAPEHVCFEHRGLQPWVEDSCVNCWLQWFTTGE